MRRIDREITDRDAMDDVLNRAPLLFMAMVDNGDPYVVPLSFGYDGLDLYFHGAPDGRKVGILRDDAGVCFTAVVDEELVTADAACNYGVKGRSVVGTGTVEFITDPAAKRKAFDIIMRHHATGDFTYPDEMVENTAVFKLAIDTLTMKAIGYPKT